MIDIFNRFECMAGIDVLNKVKHKNNNTKWKYGIFKVNFPFTLKGAISGLRQFLAAETPLKMMKNAFPFTSKALFVLKIFTFLSWLFGHCAKRLDQKDKVNFNFFDVTAWLASNCNTHIVQYLEKQRQSDNEIRSVDRMQHEKHFSWKIIHKMWWRN